MAAILDTGFLFALANAKDRNHHRVLDVSKHIDTELVLPVSVFPEVCYLIATRLGYPAMLQFLNNAINSDITIQSVTKEDLERTIEILNTYSDAKLDFVDASIASMAERLGITRILTLDRRDFSIIKPRHCGYFEILPE